MYLLHKYTAAVRKESDNSYENTFYTCCRLTSQQILDEQFLCVVKVSFTSHIADCCFTHSEVDFDSLHFIDSSFLGGHFPACDHVQHRSKMAARPCWIQAVFRFTRHLPLCGRQCQQLCMDQCRYVAVRGRMQLNTSCQQHDGNGLAHGSASQQQEEQSHDSPRHPSTMVLQDEALEVPKAPDSHRSSSFLYDELANKFINCMMWDGKKYLSQKIFKGALEIIKQKQLSHKVAGDKGVVELDPVAVFHRAVSNAMPLMGTISVKKGGKAYQVPVGLPEKRRRFLAIKWLITAARERKGTAGMARNLAAELLDAYNNSGTVIKKKQDLHRLAEVNRAFAHYRWL